MKTCGGGAGRQGEPSAALESAFDEVLPPDDLCAWENLDAWSLMHGLQERLQHGRAQTLWGHSTLLWMNSEGDGDGQHQDKQQKLDDCPKSAKPDHISARWIHEALEHSNTNVPYQFVFVGLDHATTTSRRKHVLNQVLAKCAQSGKTCAQRVDKLRQNFRMAEILIQALRLPEASTGLPLVRKLHLYYKKTLTVHAMSEVPVLDLSRMWEFDLFVQLAGPKRAKNTYVRCNYNDTQDPIGAELRFAKSLEALQYFGLNEEEITSLLRIFRAVLELGHIGLQESHEEAQTHVETVSNLLGTTNLLQTTLFHPSSWSKNIHRSSVERETLLTRHSRFARDALAESLFDAAFRWILMRVNRTLMQDSRESTGTLVPSSTMSFVEMPTLASMQQFATVLQTSKTHAVEDLDSLLRNTTCETVHLLLLKSLRQAEVKTQCLLNEVRDTNFIRAQEAVENTQHIIEILEHREQALKIRHVISQSVSVEHFCNTAVYHVKSMEPIDSAGLMRGLAQTSRNLFLCRILDAWPCNARSSTIKRHRMGMESLISPLREGRLHFVVCLSKTLQESLTAFGCIQLAQVRAEACFPLRKPWDLIIDILPDEARARLGVCVDRNKIRAMLEEYLHDHDPDLPFHVGKQFVYFVHESWNAFLRAIELSLADNRSLQSAGGSEIGLGNSYWNEDEEPIEEEPSPQERHIVHKYGQNAFERKTSSHKQHSLGAVDSVEVVELSNEQFGQVRDTVKIKHDSLNSTVQEQDQTLKSTLRFDEFLSVTWLDENLKGTAYSLSPADEKSASRRISQISRHASSHQSSSPIASGNYPFIITGRRSQRLAAYREQAVLLIQRTWRMWSCIRRLTGLDARRRRWRKFLRPDEAVVITSLVVKTVTVWGRRPRRNVQAQHSSSKILQGKSPDVSLDSTRSPGSGDRLESNVSQINGSSGTISSTVHAQHAKHSIKSRKIRQLIYTSGPHPRLFYIDPFSGEFKGDIAWEEGSTYAVATSNADFVVYSIPDPFKAKTEWHFTVIPSTNDALAQDWVRALQRAYTVPQLFRFPRGVFEYTPTQRAMSTGPLLKRTWSATGATWREHYFVLRVNSLEWFRRKGDVDCRGFIIIDHCTGVYASKEQFSFEITSPSLAKPLRLRANSEDELFYWVTAITRAITTSFEKADSLPKPLPQLALTPKDNGTTISNSQKAQCNSSLHPATKSLSIVTSDLV